MKDIFSITRDALKKKLSLRGNFALLDVLPTRLYRKKHIPGAINVDVEKKNFVKRVSRLVPDKNKQIILYCKEFLSPRSAKAAKKLSDAGYTDIVRYEGGLQDWQNAGNEVATGECDPNH